MTMSNFCVYCEEEKPVKIWKETNEYVCLSCRLSLIAQEFEGIASKEDCDQVKYYSELLNAETVVTKFDQKGTKIMKPSEIKLTEFNGCPGADPIKDYLYKHYLEPYVKVVDLDESHSFHINDQDTLVLAILKGPTETQVALAIGQMAVQFAADEFTWKAIEDTYIIRLWWD